MKALSLREPWCWAILHAGKRIENRRRNLGRPTEPFLLHSAVGSTRSEFAFAVDWMVARKLVASAAAVPSLDEIQCGGIVGVARVVDMIPPAGFVSSNAEFGFNTHPHANNPWWMREQHGYVLRDVHALPFLPVRGMLGFFTVPDDVAARATAAIAALRGAA